MKTNIFLTLFLLLSLSCVSNAQSVIKFNPLALAFGTLNVGYEQGISDKTSFYVGGSIIFRKIAGIKYSGGGVGGQYRFYLTDTELPKGLYVGPAASVSFVSYDSFGSGFNYTLIQLGALIGYQWTFSDQFTVELGIGPSYGIVAGDDSEGIDLFGDGVVPIGILSVGYILSGK